MTQPTPSHSNTNPSMQGVMFVLLASILWGTTGTAHSFAPPGMAAHWVGALRLAVAALFFVVLASVAAKSRKTPSAKKPLFSRGCDTATSQQTAMPVARLLLCALCMVVYNLAFFDGLRRTGVGLGTAVAIGSSPVFAGLLGAALAKRWPPRAWWLGTVIGIAGGALMAFANQHGAAEAAHLASGWALVAGLALCLLAGLAYGSYAVLCQPLLARTGVARVNAWVFTTAAVLSLPAAAWLGGAFPEMAARGWAVVIYLGLFATGLAYWFFSQGLQKISAATGVALSKAEPIAAFILAVAVLGEPVNAQAITGLLLVLVGLAVVTRSEMQG